MPLNFEQIDEVKKIISAELKKGVTIGSQTLIMDGTNVYIKGLPAADPGKTGALYTAAAVIKVSA